MAGLQLKHVYKVYPNGLKAVSDFTMDIEDKEFIVFVGPSGCGKSTTLRMIAGLEEISAGEIYIDGEMVNDVEPKDRDIAMVFQNYALYPHMTVYENMAFGLKLRKLNKAQIDAKVREAAEILGISDYLKKKPKEMSGGQRQRVALGRAIVREPKVFLLDEPLSNLDAKLRTTMRAEISKLHNKLKTTFIYVTHDQIEAMTMGTRIVVMKEGFVQQIDTPRNLYSYPVNKFVAGFIGTPQMNFYAGKITKNGDDVIITFDNTDVSLSAPSCLFKKADKTYFDGNAPLYMGIRSEHISVDPDAYPYTAKCRVSYVEDLGIDSQVYADFNLNADDEVKDSATKIVIKAPAGTHFNMGEIITISIDVSHMHVFDGISERSIIPRIPQEKIVDVAVKKGKLNILGENIKLPPAIVLDDGNYTMHIPTTAITEGKEIAATFTSREDINGTCLSEMNVNGEPVFIMGDGEKVQGLNIDLKSCSFTLNGKEVKGAINSRNKLSAKFVKVKENKNIKYFLNGDAFSYECPKNIAEKILATVGKEAFKCQYEIIFSPEDVIVSEGAGCTVCDALDYGEEKILVCNIGASAVNVAINKNVDRYAAQPTLIILPDLPKCEIHETSRDIRIV